MLFELIFKPIVIKINENKELKNSCKNQSYFKSNQIKYIYVVQGNALNFLELVEETTIEGITQVEQIGPLNDSKNDLNLSI